MNILQAHKYYWHRDGASNYMLELAKLLKAHGDAVIPFAMKEQNSLQSKYSKFFVSEMNLRQPEQASFLQKIRYAGRMVSSREAKQKMRALLADTSVDIAHLHNIYHHISASILPVLKKQGIPIVMTLHDYKLIAPNYTMFHHGAVHEEDARGWHLSCIKNKCMKDSRMQSAIVTAEMIWQHKIMRYWERYVDRFIAPSEFILETCVRFGWPREKFVHIPHPIDLSGFAYTPEDDGYVLYVGRLSEEKGLNTLIDAAKQTPEIPYRIVGTGPMEEVLHARVHTEQIDNVMFDGFQSGAALKKLIAGARVTILPSIWYENYPLSVLEAKASGSIVIASDIGGLPELIDRARLFPPGDGGALAKRIRHWHAESEQLRLEAARAQRNEVESVNDPEEHVAAIRSLYQQLV